VVAVTVTVPVSCAGVTTLSVVVLTTVTLVAGVVPKETVDVFVNPVPVIFTVVPPVAGPVDGLSSVIVGAGAAGVTDGVTARVGGSVKLNDPVASGLVPTVGPFAVTVTPVTVPVRV
jgi:hypothetical protein